jgi:hypothetical protein
VKLYARQIREALTGAIDTGKLAEAWGLLHPGVLGKGGRPGRDDSQNPSLRSAGMPAQDVTKAINPVLAAFLARAYTAILSALRAVLGRAWPEGWVLGQLSAQALTAGRETADWGAWTPGDYAAAEAIAGAGLRQLLDSSGIVIQSIAESRLEELSAVLEATLRSDETQRPPLPEPLPPMLSVGDLARQLLEVLDNPDRAELVAQAEIGRAQAEASRAEYAVAGIAEVEISTAEDDKVCPICGAAEKVGAHPLGSPPMVLLHPRCRCAELPVLAGAR